jgi:hypothetical protein
MDAKSQAMIHMKTSGVMLSPRLFPTRNTPKAFLARQQRLPKILTAV